jgi:exonuclease III
VTIYAWNVERLKKEEIGKILYDHKPDILCLSEIKAREDRKSQEEF